MGGGSSDPVYHYHSNYDSFHWMKTMVDPDFKIHTTAGQYITLLAYHLADDTVIPYDIGMYSGLPDDRQTVSRVPLRTNAD